MPTVPRATRAPDEPPRAFVEVALVRYAPEAFVGPLPRASREPGANWLDDLPVTVAWSAHLLASNQKPATMSIAPASPASVRCPARNARELTVTPHLQPARSGLLRLDLALTGTTPSPSDASDCAETSPIRTTVLVSNQQTVLLAVDRSRGAVLALTPYLIRSDDDLEQLRRCKLAQRSASAPSR